MQYNEIVDFIKSELTAINVSDYEIFYLESDDMTIELKEKKVDSFVKAIDKSLFLRVLNGGRIGFSYCTKINKDGIKKMVESAYDTSKDTKSDDCNKFAKKDYGSLPEIRDYDNGINDIPFDEKVEALKRLEEAAYGYDDRVKSARKLEFSQSVKDVRVFNSLGIDCLHKKTLFSFSAMVAAREGDESEISWESDFSNFYHKLDPESVGKDAAKKACEALNGRVIKSGKLPVILDRLISSELISVLSPSFYADHVLKNKSAFKDKIGERILSENITIKDDPLYDGGLATFPFDAEGSASKTTGVVERGVLTSYLSDTYTSNKLKIENSSNSIKGSLFAPPAVGNTNLYVVPGARGKDEIIRDMDRGLIITDVMGLHTANPISGDFSIGMAGFFVEGGEKAFPVRGLVFSGNLFKLLNCVEEVADDLKFYMKCASPSLKITCADIAGV